MHFENDFFFKYTIPLFETYKNVLKGKKWCSIIAKMKNPFMPMVGNSYAFFKIDFTLSDYEWLMVKYPLYCLCRPIQGVFFNTLRMFRLFIMTRKSDLKHFKYMISHGHIPNLNSLE